MQRAVVLLATCCCNAASSCCHVAWFMALSALSRAEHRSRSSKSRTADSMVRRACGEARVARQGEGAVAWRNVEDDGWHRFLRCDVAVVVGKKARG